MFFGLDLLTHNAIKNLVKVKAVKTDVIIPIARVMENPFIGPDPS